MKLSRDLRFLGLALFLWASGEGMFIYILPLYMQSLGADSVKIGLLYSLGAVAAACTLIPAGLVTDRLGPNAALISGWLVGVVAGALMAFARDMTWFTVGWLLYAAAAWVTPAIAAYAAHGRGDLPTERAITSVSSMYHAGLIVAPAVGGWLGQNLGTRAPFVVATFMFSVSTIAILLLTRQPPHPAHEHARPADLLSNRHFVGFMVLVFGVMAAIYLGFALAPKFLSDVKHVSLEQIGLLGSASALGGFALNQWLGRRPPRRAFMAAVAMVFVSLALMLGAQSLVWFALAYFLRAAFNVSRGLVDALVSRIVQPSQLGVSFAVAETVATAATAVSPYAAGWLYAASPYLPFQLALALIPIAIGCIALFAPRHSANVPGQPAAVPAD